MMAAALPTLGPTLREFGRSATSGRPMESRGLTGTAAPAAVALRVQAAPKTHHRWLEARTGCVLTRQARAIEAVDAYGRVCGMVAYDCWTENSVQAHMAVVAPLVWRRLLPDVFRYPFVQAGKGLLLGVIPEHNARSARMVERLGFTLAHRVPDGWAVGDDLLIYQMRREACRWL